MKNLIYTATQIDRTITRMAYEIYEHNLDEEMVVIAGIHDQGYALASLLAAEIEKISPLKIMLVGLHIDKQQPHLSEVKCECDNEPNLDDTVLVVVDDVLNSGKTIMYCLKALLKHRFKKIDTAVLVNRSHKLYPISARFKGFDLSTTISEHVEVRLAAPVGVYLH